MPCFFEFLFSISFLGLSCLGLLLQPRSCFGYGTFDPIYTVMGAWSMHGGFLGSNLPNAVHDPQGALVAPVIMVGRFDAWRHQDFSVNHSLCVPSPAASLGLPHPGGSLFAAGGRKVKSWPIPGQISSDAPGGALMILRVEAL